MPELADGDARRVNTGHLEISRPVLGDRQIGPGRSGHFRTERAKSSGAEVDRTKIDPAKADRGETGRAEAGPAKTERGETGPARTGRAKTGLAATGAKTERAKTERAKTGRAKTGLAATGAKTERAKTGLAATGAKTERAKTERAKMRRVKIVDPEMVQPKMDVRGYIEMDLAEVDHEAIAALENAGGPDEEPGQLVPTHRVAGRGAVSNPAVRFDQQATAAFDDGWETLTQDVGDLPRLDTSLIRDASRSAISWNTSPDIGFDRAINPYRGCEHGCIYCYARPTHAYLGYSPGLDFETKLLFKPEVAELLEKELRKPGYAARTLALGSNTDPYQPVERTLKLTRSVLQVLDRFNHPVGIVTKSAGVLRDLDILASMAERNLARVYLSVTTLDPRLARVMEPRAATPARRLQTIAELAGAGVPAGVLVAPMIPALNDSEMEKIVEAAARAGATQAGYVLLRLPLELRQMFEDWLQIHFPDRARHVLSLIRETRAGNLSDPRFHHRFTGQGVYADLLARRFARVAREFGLDQSRSQLACDRFVVPDDPAVVSARQMSLF